MAAAAATAVQAGDGHAVEAGPQLVVAGQQIAGSVGGRDVTRRCRSSASCSSSSASTAASASPPLRTRSCAAASDLPAAGLARRRDPRPPRAGPSSSSSTSLRRAACRLLLGHEGLGLADDHRPRQLGRQVRRASVELAEGPLEPGLAVRDDLVARRRPRPTSPLADGHRRAGPSARAARSGRLARWCRSWSRAVSSSWSGEERLERRRTLVVTASGLAAPGFGASWGSAGAAAAGGGVGAGGGGPVRQLKTGVPAGTEVSGQRRSSTSGGTGAPVAFLSRPKETAGAAAGRSDRRARPAPADALGPGTRTPPPARRSGGRTGGAGGGRPVLGRAGRRG